MWSHVVFEHPASFQTLAMDRKKKKGIMDDLVTFSKAKEYYARIGKSWKHWYHLYGCPGTGKSTMVAAMANFLNYDVYDLELTAVKNNTELRKLLIETPGRGRENQAYTLFGLLNFIDGLWSANVAENLMAKTMAEDAGSCLGSLIEALMIAKEEARKKADNEEKLTDEKDPK
ncbi:hypothetical protein U1Q18_038454 [Sarracenia purpurea var. burkii]